MIRLRSGQLLFRLDCPVIKSYYTTKWTPWFYGRRTQQFNATFKFYKCCYSFTGAVYKYKSTTLRRVQLTRLQRVSSNILYFYLLLVVAHTHIHTHAHIYQPTHTHTHSTLIAIRIRLLCSENLCGWATLIRQSNNFPTYPLYL